MQKQTLTFENILTDLRLASSSNKERHMPATLGFSLLFALLAVLLLVCLPTLPLLSIMLAVFSILFGVHYARERKQHRSDARALRAALDRAHLSVCIEEFSHAGEEVVVEPHSCGRHMHATRLARMIYFTSGIGWRVPLYVSRLYDWSNTHHLTFEGLQNISLAGDEFYYISLQGHPDISFAYPCKFFVLAKELEGSATQKAQ